MKYFYTSKKRGQSLSSLHNYKINY